MSVATALLALALGGSTPPGATGDGAGITFQFRILEMRGLAWRTALFHQLEPVARRGGSTVWTIDEAGASSLVASAAKVQTTPKVTTSGAGAPATVHANATRHFVSQVRRVSDGPPFQGTKVAFLPEVDTIGEGVWFEVAGRAIEQGVLARVKVEHREVLALQTVLCHDGVQAKAGEACDASACDVKVEGSPALTQAASELGRALGLVKAAPTEVRRITGKYQVPEVVEGEASGEWLIPARGALIIGLGLHTCTAADGKAEAWEKVVVIEATPAPATPASTAAALPPMPIGTARSFPLAAAGAPSPDPVVQAGYVPPPMFVPVPPFAPAAPAAPGAMMPAPPAPSRSLPQGFDPAGLPTPLPPLPEEALRPDEGRDALMPSPQAHPDAKSSASEGEAPPPPRTALDIDVEFKDPLVKITGRLGSIQSLSPVKVDGKRLSRLEPQTIRVPLGKNLALEVRARVVADPAVVRTKATPACEEGDECCTADGPSSKTGTAAKSKDDTKSR